MHYKRNNKESKTYVQGLRPFGNTLPRGVKSILKKNGYNYSEIISKWNFLMGKEIASYCYPRSIKISKSDSKGTLVLGIERGDEINVEYSKREIINKINSYFGYKLINEIKIEILKVKSKKIKNNVTINKNSRNFEKKINEIKNQNIKNSLSALLNVYKND
jgi:hypothetical protein